MRKKYLNSKELCEMLKVSRRTIQNWKSDALIPYLSIKGKHLFCEDDIEEFLKKFKIPAYYELEKKRGFNV